MKAQKTAVIILLCIIQSCVKESSFLSYNISFNGSLNESVKSSSYLGAGIKASLFIFNRLENPTANITPGIELIASGLWELYPTSYIILQSGLYDFFSISFNDYSSPNISFNNDFLSLPQNGKDYIWASKHSKNVYDNDYVQFIYKHISTKIQITISSSESIKDLSINYIKYTLPNCTSSSLNLKTGEILPASSVLALSEISGAGYSRTFIAIPCHSQKEIEISINATIDGERVNNKIYKSFIDDPFNAGLFYIVNLNIENISTSSISLSSNDWVYKSNYIPY